MMEEIEVAECNKNDDYKSGLCLSLLSEFTWIRLKRNFPGGAVLILTLVTSVIPSLLDVFSDCALAIFEYLLKGQYLLGVLTVLFIFLPGIKWYRFKDRVTDTQELEVQDYLKCWFTISSLFFPVTFVLFKLGRLINHGETAKMFSIYISECEILYEAIPQLCLQLYIICMTGSYTTLQLLAILTSFFTCSVGPAEAFLHYKISMDVDEGMGNNFYAQMNTIAKAPHLLKILPFFTIQIIFRVFSFVLITSILGIYSFAVYPPICFLLFVIGGCGAASIADEYGGICSLEFFRRTTLYSQNLIITSIFTLETIQFFKARHLLIFWTSTNILLSMLSFVLAWSFPDTFLSENQIFNDVHILIGTLMITIITGVAAIILYYSSGIHKTLLSREIGKLYSIDF